LKIEAAWPFGTLPHYYIVSEPRRPQPDSS